MRICAVVTAVRPRYWLKNSLVFVPALVADRVTDPAALLPAACAFLAFSLAASSAYVVNDILDRDTDRVHPVKCRRPFASDALAVQHGVVLALLLACGAIATAAYLLPSPRGGAGPIGAYLILSTAYSMGAKRVFLADIVLLAALYTVRIIGGGVASGAPVSTGLVVCSMVGFTSLALLKRLVELQLPRSSDCLPGRGYRNGHRKCLQHLALLTGCVAAGILAVLCNRSIEPLEAGAIPWVQALTALCAGYWVTRVWWLACRDRLGPDPLAFVLKDPRSYAVGAVIIAALIERG